MAVPANWQGTPERFYHFLLGYLVPLLIWQERSDERAIAVRESGPHNAWFELLHPDTSIEFLPPGMMLERYLSHRQERVVFHDWDNPTRFRRKSLTRARGTAIRNLQPMINNGQGRPRITVLDRGPSVDHYRSDVAETHGGGAEWRSLPNVKEIATSLELLGDVRILDTAGMTPQEQVSSLLQTDVLVAQHGGGLSNMLWMESGKSVIEILPPRPPTIDAIFHNLAAACRLGYRAVPQESEHSPVDTQPILQAAQDLLESPAAHVPTPTGSWPMRMVRQLPRRL